MYIKQLLKCVHDYQCLIGMPILYAYKPGVTYKCLQWKGALSVKNLRGLSPELGIVRAQLFPRCIQNASTQAFPAKYSMLFILYVSKEHSLGDIYNPTHLWQNAAAPISAVIHTINPPTASVPSEARNPKGTQHLATCYCKGWKIILWHQKYTCIKHFTYILFGHKVTISVFYLHECL